MLAPAALLDANVSWTPVDGTSIKAAFSRPPHTVNATLTFDAHGDLVGFLSGDRLLTEDGKTWRSYPWSTPLRGHRDYGGVRLPARGEAAWLRPEGPLTYGEFETESVEYNVGVR